MHAAARRGFKALPMGLKVDAADRQCHPPIRFRQRDRAVAGRRAQARIRRVLRSLGWLGPRCGRRGDRRGGGQCERGRRAHGARAIVQPHAARRRSRSIVFIAFTGGESGRLGSRYYVEHPVFALEQTSGAINLDRLHIGGRTRDVMVFGAGNSELEESVRGLALLQGREVRPDNRPELGRYYDSDQLSFALRGVPALYVKSGVDDEARGPQWGAGAVRGLSRAPLPAGGRQVLRGLGPARRRRGSGAIPRGRASGWRIRGDFRAGSRTASSAATARTRCLPIRDDFVPMRRAGAGLGRSAPFMDHLALADAFPMLAAVEAAGGIVGIEPPIRSGARLALARRLGARPATRTVRGVPRAAPACRS